MQRNQAPVRRGGGRISGPFGSTRSCVQLLINVDDLGRWEAIEPGAAGLGVGADVGGVDEVAEVEVGGKFFGQGDGVQGIAGGAEDGTELGGSFGAFFEGADGVFAVVEDD